MDKKIKNYILVFIAFIINVFIVLVFPFECPWKKNLGIDCAGCGATRMIRSIFKLDFYQAFRYNIFSILLLPILFIYGVSSSYAWIFNKKNLLEKKIPTVFWIIVIVLMLTYGIIRNLPMFSFLAPTLI